MSKFIDDTIKELEHQISLRGIWIKSRLEEIAIASDYLKKFEQEKIEMQRELQILKSTIDKSSVVE